MPDEVGIVVPGASRPKSETPAAAARRAAAVAACGEVLRRRVLHRDRHLLVLDKPAGLPVQGGPGAPAALPIRLHCWCLHAILGRESGLGSEPLPKPARMTCNAPQASKPASDCWR